MCVKMTYSDQQLGMHSAVKKREQIIEHVLLMAHYIIRLLYVFLRRSPFFGGLFYVERDDFIKINMIRYTL